MKRSILPLIITLFLSFTLVAQSIDSVIPKIDTYELKKGSFPVSRNTVITGSPLSRWASDNLSRTIGLRVNTFMNAKNNRIVFTDVDSTEVNSEGYNISISEKEINISASSESGHFYAAQTLIQLLKGNKFERNKREEPVLLPSCEIKDQPRFAYRGLMLDVARHFYSVEEVKRVIDLMALYKLNTLHWHLTDDQGWRIEIKKYPKLTEIGSQRKETMKGHYRDMTFDGTPHGGFYTQNDIKEVITYAARKSVTIIPEIEMPGHAQAALASYPELGCTEGPYEVGTLWGVSKNVYCPTEKTFTFLQDVLTEVMDLFPSTYIHIGGDECPKDAWKASEFCQNLIKEKGLKDEYELQSYFIKRIDNFLTSKGRKLIGWDEILEGGLSPNATVMSWRGVQGGIEAAREGHDVIMTPNSHLYFDYYQGNPENEPLAIGGFLPLKQVYSYEPFDSKLTKEEASRIVGVQANLWTEYIADIKKVEYMLFPRLLALSEIGWTKDLKKDYANFSSRVISQFPLMEAYDINFSKALFHIELDKVTPLDGNIEVSLASDIPNTVLKFTTDGSEPKVSDATYNSPLSLSQSGVLKASIYKDGEKKGNTFTKEFRISNITGQKGTFDFKPTKYNGGSSNGLTNGMKGSIFKLDEWVGLNGENLNIVYDVNPELKTSKLVTSTLHAPSSWIMAASKVEVWGQKEGKKWKKLAAADISIGPDVSDRVEDIILTWRGQKFNKVRIHIHNHGNLPKGHPGEGRPAWLFVDEIELY